MFSGSLASGTVVVYLACGPSWDKTGVHYLHCFLHWLWSPWQPQFGTVQILRGFLEQTSNTKSHYMYTMSFIMCLIFPCPSHISSTLKEFGRFSGYKLLDKSEFTDCHVCQPNFYFLLLKIAYNKLSYLYFVIESHSHLQKANFTPLLDCTQQDLTHWSTTPLSLDKVTQLQWTFFQSSYIYACVFQASPQMTSLKSLTALVHYWFGILKQLWKWFLRGQRCMVEWFHWTFKLGSKYQKPIVTCAQLQPTSVPSLAHSRFIWLVVQKGS